ncbi:MAG: NAD+ synthase [Chloroflexota bacterium]|nr:NAD+ synthase [Chloroflexota bacterium]
MPTTPLTAATVLDRLAIAPDLTRRLLVEFIRNEVRKFGFERMVFGLSGGIDSALAAYLAAEALGPANLFAVLMPYRTSSPASLADAQLVVDDLGLPHETVEITPMVEPLFARFPDINDARKGNAMARQRMIILFDQSLARGALVLGTSNKTESLLGYTTWYGDSAASIQPIGDLYKTQVRALSRAVGVPQPILDKQPSADLWPGQTDESELGISYDDVDQVLYLLVDERMDASRVIELGFAEALVTRVLRLVKGMQYKRMMPIIAKVGSRTPGVDFRYPRDWGH